MASPGTTQLLQQVRELNEKKEFNQVIELLTPKSIGVRRNAELFYELAIAEEQTDRNPLSSYSSAINIDPSFTEAYAGRAAAYEQGRHYQRAIEDYTTAIKLDPDNSDYYISRGYVFALMNDHDNEAISDFTKAIELDPDSDEGYSFRGIVHNTWERFDEAIADFDKAIANNEANAYYYTQRAIAWFGKEEYDNAISDLTQAIKIEPNKSDYWRRRTNVWHSKKEYDKALEDISQAILLQPDLSIAYFERAVIWEEKKELDRAVEDYGKAIELDTDFMEALIRRADIWMAKKEYRKAIQDYNKVVELTEDYTEIYYRRGIACYEFQDYNEAVINFKKVIELEPENQEAIEWKAKAQGKLRESPGNFGPRQSIREQVAFFIEQISKDYSIKFVKHTDGFVHGEKVTYHWDAVNKRPIKSGILGWLPAFRPDLAKWDEYENPHTGKPMVYVYTLKNEEFYPEGAGIPMSTKLWEDIVEAFSTPPFERYHIGKVQKFDKVAPMLNRVAAHVRAGRLDHELIFGKD